MNVKSSISSNKGFTFLELLTGLFVGSALLVFGMPLIESHQAKVDTNAMDTQFAEQLNRAREIAVANGGVVSVCASYDGKSCSESNWQQGWLTYNDSENYDAGEQISAADIITYKALDHTDVSFSVLDESSKNVFRIRFDAHGFNLEHKKLYAGMCTDYKTDHISGLVTVERTGRIDNVNLAANTGRDKALSAMVASGDALPVKCASKVVASL